MLRALRRTVRKFLNNEKAFRDLGSGFVLTYGERTHRKQFSRWTDGGQSVQCVCSVCSMFFRFLKVNF